jgi:hypothetical protein
MTKFHDDPTLDELLGDPITQAIMHADRVDPAKLEAMLRSLARAVAGRSRTSAVGPLSRPVGASRDTTTCCWSGPGIRSQHCGTP